METFISIIHLKSDLVFGFHACPNPTTSEEYIWQTAGDAYACLARNNRINSKTKMIVITVTQKGPKIVVINDDQSLLNSNIEDFLKEYLNKNDQPKKMDSIKVIHSNYKIDHYSPYIDVDCPSEIFCNFKEVLTAVAQLPVMQVYQLKSVIWEKIQHEKQQLPIRP